MAKSLSHKEKKQIAENIVNKTGPYKFIADKYNTSKSVVDRVAKNLDYFLNCTIITDNCKRVVTRPGTKNYKKISF